MKEDLVSIIVPVYNVGKFIDDTINSVKEQTYNNWELILVNDCSTDNSLDIIRKYESDKIKIINLEKNLGAAQARNRGIKEAKGRYIAFIDGDDYWKKDKLEKQISFMEEKKCAFSFTGYEFASEDGVPNGKTVKVPDKITYKQALRNTTISTITVMFDLKNLEKDNIMMPDFRRGQDTLTWWKVLKIVDYAYGLDEVLSIYRRSNNTLSSNKFKALKRTWNLYRKGEKLSVVYSAYNFIFYVINAIKRRV